MLAGEILSFLLLSILLVMFTGRDKSMLLDHECASGPYKRKAPSKTANIILVVLIMLGSAMVVFYFPVSPDKTMIGAIGVVIAAIACVARYEINSKIVVNNEMLAEN